MKIAITGATQGLGLSMLQIWNQHGHHCENFSRTTGHDINDHDAMIKAVADFDLFINNAYDGFAQTEMLYGLFAAWQGQRKYIINIGSDITNRWFHDSGANMRPLPWTSQRRPDYHTTKKSLEQAQQFLCHQNPWPKMMMVKPGPLLGPNAALKSQADKDFASRSKMDPDRVAQLIYQLWDQRADIFVSDISISPLDLRCDG